jgi:hypothetical protein
VVDKNISTIGGAILAIQNIIKENSKGELK